jgi:hypothetical protein
MENQQPKKPMTPEKLLSESEEDQNIMPGYNMPKMVGTPVHIPSKPNSDVIAHLARNLNSSSVLKDAFDLEELKRKQQDLLLIQQMVQK